MAQASEAGANARAGVGKDVKDSTEDAATQTAASEVARKLGRFGGIGAAGLGGLNRGRKKAEAEAPKTTSAPKAADPDAGVNSTLNHR